MTGKQRRSSRARMEGRNKKRRAPSPSVIRMEESDQVILANRAAKRQHAYFVTHSTGLSVRQEQREKRKQLQTQARRELREMRKETRAAMKAASGC